MKYLIAVDFDGTLVDHCYPAIGSPVPGAFEWCREFIAAGAGLILWTVRSDESPDGKMLMEAVLYCLERGLSFVGVNYSPGQRTWSGSAKAYAHIYIDDAAYGCPLRENPRMGGRPLADWDRIGPAVLAKIKEAGR